LEAGLVSVLTKAGPDTAAEVWTVGDDGVAGALVVLGTAVTPYRWMVQIEGSALRMSPPDLRRLMDGLCHFARLCAVISWWFSIKAHRPVPASGIAAGEHSWIRLRSATPGSRVMRSKSMTWTTPIVREICVGMEVTSYESAEIESVD